MLLQLALTGLLVAILPLSVVWVAADPDKYRKLSWVTLFLTFDLVMFGAFTRLTDSGLGCPDWPGCYGQANPLQAHAEISAAQTAMPTGPVTVGKAWVEMIHRYLAMSVGVLIIAMLAIAWRRWLKSRPRDHRFHPGLPTALLAFVCLQGAFGAWTVTLKLQPVIVTTHLLLGMTLLGLLAWQAARQNAVTSPPPSAVPLRGLARVALAVVGCQIALGGWVSTNYAALACHDFPLCHGQWLPQVDFANGFSLWRQLGKTAGGDYLPFPALTAIHLTHRTFAYVVALIVLWTGYRTARLPGNARLGRWIMTVVAMQLATGISTIFLRWPLGLAVAHNGGAALLMVLLVMLNFRTISTPRTTSDRPFVRLHTG